MDEDDAGDVEYQAYFTDGDCICVHSRDEHGWMSCDVDGCPCEARWEH